MVIKFYAHSGLCNTEVQFIWQGELVVKQPSDRIALKLNRNAKNQDKTLHVALLGFK